MYSISKIKIFPLKSKYQTCIFVHEMILRLNGLLKILVKLDAFSNVLINILSTWIHFSQNWDTYKICIHPLTYDTYKMSICLIPLHFIFLHCTWKNFHSSSPLPSTFRKNSLLGFVRWDSFRSIWGCTT